MTVWGGILSGGDIAWALEHERLVIDPLLEPIQPASVDLRLHDQILIPHGRRILYPALGIGPKDEPESFSAHALAPNKFVNVATLEWIEVPPHLVGFVAGKSTLARMGLQIEAAGLVDPGWRGRLTLEVKNLGPDTIVLETGMKIAQIYFLPIFQLPPRHLYGNPALKSRYQGAERVQAGRPSAETLPER